MEAIQMKDRIAETLEAWRHLPDFDDLVTVLDDLFFNVLADQKTVTANNCSEVIIKPKQIDRDQTLEIISNLGDNADVDSNTFQDIYNCAIILSQYDEINANTIKQAYYQLKTKQ